MWVILGSEVGLCAVLGQRLNEEERKPVRGTGYGIVTFNYEAHCKNMLRDHHKSNWQKLISNVTFGMVTVGEKSPQVRQGIQAGGVEWWSVAEIVFFPISSQTSHSRKELIAFAEKQSDGNDKC